MVLVSSYHVALLICRVKRCSAGVVGPKGTQELGPSAGNRFAGNRPASMKFYAFLLMILAMATAECIAGENEHKLQPLKYNNPGLVVDLGVGLWAWPMPMDYDGDGDMDLLVATRIAIVYVKEVVCYEIEKPS